MTKCIRVVYYDFVNHVTARATHTPNTSQWVFHEPWMRDESHRDTDLSSRARVLIQRHCKGHKAFIESCAAAITDEMVEKKVYAVAPLAKVSFKLYEMQVYSADVEQDDSSLARCSGEIEAWLDVEEDDE